MRFTFLLMALICSIQTASAQMPHPVKGLIKVESLKDHWYSLDRSKAYIYSLKDSDDTVAFMHLLKGVEDLRKHPVLNKVRYVRKKLIWVTPFVNFGVSVARFWTGG